MRDSRPIFNVSVCASTFLPLSLSLLAPTWQGPPVQRGYLAPAAFTLIASSPAI